MPISEHVLISSTYIYFPANLLVDKLLSGDDGGGIFDDPPVITDSVMMPPDHGDDDDDDYDHLSRELINLSNFYIEQSLCILFNLSNPAVCNVSISGRSSRQPRFRSS